MGTWNNHTGVTTMTYIPALKKYMIVISTPTFSPYTTKQFYTYILESDNITGPWTYITYMYMFGPEAYFVHFPSKFQDASVSPPYHNGFLSYSANFAFHGNSTPAGSGYHWSLQKH